MPDFLFAILEGGELVLKLKSPIEVTFETLQVQTVLHLFDDIEVFTWK